MVKVKATWFFPINTASHTDQTTDQGKKIIHTENVSAEDSTGTYSGRELSR